MKTFHITHDGKSLCFSSLTALRTYLLAHPDIQGVRREWWSGQEFIEETPLTREDILTQKANDLRRGMTALWAQAHHMV